MFGSVSVAPVAPTEECGGVTLGRGNLGSQSEQAIGTHRCRESGLHPNRPSVIPTSCPSAPRVREVRDFGLNF